MNKKLEPPRYLVGYYCNDGSFAVLIKKKQGIGFNTRLQAEDYIKNIQPKYKHKLAVFHNW